MNTTELFREPLRNLVRSDGNACYWLENRRRDKGRSMLVKCKQNHIQDVLPAGYSAQSSVHEYGGGSYDVCGGRVCFTNKSVEAAVIASGCDFYSNPRFHPEGNKICWLQWNHPLMPWDGCELWQAEFVAGQKIQAVHTVAGGKKGIHHAARMATCRGIVFSLRSDRLLEPVPVQLRKNHTGCPDGLRIRHSGKTHAIPPCKRRGGIWIVSPSSPIPPSGPASFNGNRSWRPHLSSSTGLPGRGGLFSVQWIRGSGPGLPRQYRLWKAIQKRQGKLHRHSHFSIFR